LAFTLGRCARGALAKKSATLPHRLVELIGVERRRIEDRLSRLSWPAIRWPVLMVPASATAPLTRPPLSSMPRGAVLVMRAAVRPASAATA